MQVTIIGSGNVATVMGRALLANAHTINEVYGRNKEQAQLLAAEFNAHAVTELLSLKKNSDLYIIAVTDDALMQVAPQLSFPGKLVIHTAGTVSKNILQSTSTEYGVIWPVTMIRKTMHTLKEATMVIDGSSEKVTKMLHELSAALGSSVIIAGDETRAKMHMLASITLNFTNHLYHMAADICEAEDIDFGIFHPLIEASAARLKHQHPRELQGGPAFRGDQVTVEKHLQLLSKYPRAEKLYRCLTESITEKFWPDGKVQADKKG